MYTISIITINYNNALGLEKTIQSVLTQTYKNFEHIIIDGNSTDGSKNVIEKYKDFFNYSISEPDTGVYNAMNKGIKVSKGKYLLFLNSGDILKNETILSNVSKELELNLDIYYGNLILDRKSNKTEVKYPNELTFRFFYQGSLPHPASFIKRELFDTISYYNENFKIVSDWEFFICAICKYNVSYKHINQVLSIFHTDGMSNMDKNKELIKKERDKVINKHFPLFKKNIDELIEYKKYKKINRFKMILELEQFPFAQKLNSIWLNVLLLLFKNKKTT